MHIEHRQPDHSCDLSLAPIDCGFDPRMHGMVCNVPCSAKRVGYERDGEARIVAGESSQAASASARPTSMRAGSRSATTWAAATATDWRHARPMATRSRRTATRTCATTLDPAPLLTGPPSGGLFVSIPDAIPDRSGRRAGRRFTTG